MKLVRALHHAGVPLLAGTDVGNPFLVPGYSLHKELELFVEGGLTPLEALQTATINPARFLEAAEAGAELGTGAPVGQLLREWEETAAIYADPELYEQLTRPLPGSDRSVPEPPLATDR